MNGNQKYLIVIAGPTASGKTSSAIQAAKHFNTEIISCDSRQIYREMNIGTAKPSQAELDQVPHHFINHCSIQDSYDAGIYEKEVNRLLDHLYKKHDVVVMAGGTGLFINAATKGLDDLPEKSFELREKWQNILDTKGIAALQNELKKLDPEKWESIDQDNPQRLIRAIEICTLSGKTHSQVLGLQNTKRPYKCIYIGLDIPRELLYDRINQRVDDMIENGLIKETKDLFEFRHLNSLKTVGYSELFDYYNGDVSLEYAIDKIKQHSRNYAKRQVTWFNKMGVKWIPFDRPEELLSYCKKETSST